MLFLASIAILLTIPTTCNANSTRIIHSIAIGMKIESVEKLDGGLEDRRCAVQR